MKTKHRQFCIIATIAICVVYLTYRALFTLNFDTPFAATFSVTLYLAELYGNILMFLYFFQIWDLNTPKPVPPIKGATVDVMIPTYNEELELLRGTIEAALAMDYTHTVHVLDDSKRPELRKLCDELGANYFQRDSNIHAKAGNLNHALEQTDGEFVVIFDADHIAERNFITRTIGYFCDKRLGFVQTPHAFYNFDSFQGTLNYSKKLYWEEGQLFYNVVQPGKNNWNAVSFCGSAAIFRREALEDVGLIAVESITEDLQTGIRIHANGWKSVYVNERLVSGLAAPDIETFSKQRLRWGEGNLGTIFYDNPITKPGLTFSQRLNYLASMLNWTTGVQKLLMYVTPIVMLMSGVGPVAELSWTLIAITIVYLLSVWFTVKNTGNGYVRLLDTEITQMATFWTQCHGTWRALFNRKNSRFVVTRKSGAGSNSIHRFLRPHYTLIGASVVAIVWAAARYSMGASEDISGMLICAVLVLINCGFAWIVIRRALTQRRMHWRHPVAAHVNYSFENADGEIIQGQGLTKDLSEVGASLVSFQPIDNYHMDVTLSAGDKQVKVSAEIRNRYEITNQSNRRDGTFGAWRYGLLFNDLDSAQKRDLWHICTRYAVARHYHNFDPHTNTRLIEEVLQQDDLDVSLPLNLTSPDGKFGEELVSETLNSRGFVVLSATQADDELQETGDYQVSLESMFGPIKATAKLADEAPVDLGQMQLFARRFEFKNFDGECRGKLASLLNHAEDPKVQQATSLVPKKHRASIVWPASIVGGIAALAAAIAVLCACWAYPDDALITRAMLRKDLGANGMQRLRELSQYHQANPLANETQYLRLREAFKVMGDSESLGEINRSLAESDVRTISARLQRAYALEQLGRSEEAAEHFDALIQDIDELETETSKVELLIGRARNAANLGEHQKAIDLFGIVWKEKTHNEQIRSELAGLLARQGRIQLAAAVLETGELSEEDVFLMASLQTGLNQPQQARELLKSVSSPENKTRVSRELGHLALWSRDYEQAEEVFESLLLEDAADRQLQVAIVQTLAWNKRHRAALNRGYEFEEQGTPLAPDATIAMLEAITEVEPMSALDRDWLNRTIEHVDQTGGWNEPAWADSAPTFARAIQRTLDPEDAAKHLSRLLELFSDSRELQWTYSNVLYAMGDFAGASQHYDQLLSPETLPEDLELRGRMYLGAALNSSRIGDVAQSENRYAQALNCFCEVLADDLENLSLWGSFLDACAGTSRHSDQASRHLKQLYRKRERFTTNTEMMVRLADSLARSGNPEMALGVLGELEDQSDEEITWRKSSLLGRVGELENAKSNFDELVESDAFENQPARRTELLLAAAFNDQQLNNTESSRQRYAEALVMIRPSVLANPAEQKGNWRDFLAACAGLEEISDQDQIIIDHIFNHRDPHMQDIYFVERLTDVMMILGKYEQAQVLLEALLTRQPGFDLRLRYAKLLQVRQQWKAVDNQYRILLKNVDDQPQRVEVYIGAGESARKLGRQQKAKQFGTRALTEMRNRVRIAPEDISHWQHYLNALNLVENVTEPDRVITNSIYRNSQPVSMTPTFAVAFSRSLILVGRPDAALEILNGACTRYPDNREVRVTLARSLSSERRYQEAATHFDRLIRDTDKTSNPKGRCQLLLEVSHNERLLGREAQANNLTVEAHAIIARQLEAENDPALWHCYLNAAASVPQLLEIDHQIILQIFENWKSFESNSEMLERLSDVLARCGDAERAIRPLLHLEQKGGDSKYASIRIAVLQSQKGDHAEAEARIQALLKRWSPPEMTGEVSEDSHIDLLLTGGDTARHLGKKELSNQRYAMAIGLLRNELKHGLQFESTNKLLNAVAGLQRDQLTEDDIELVEKVPTSFAQRELGQFEALPDALMKIGRADMALPIAEQIANENPTSDNLARVIHAKLELDQTEEALSLQQQLMTSGNASLQDRYLYAIGLHRLRKYELAAKQYQLLVKAAQGETMQMTFASTQQETSEIVPIEANQKIEWLLGAVENLMALDQNEKAIDTVKSALEQYSLLGEGTHELHFRFAYLLDQLQHDQEAKEFYDSLIEAKAFEDEPLMFAKLWLGAASNSGRLNDLNTMKERYRTALLLWRQIYEDSPQDTQHWTRYLDAMGGTQKLEDVDVRHADEIFIGFGEHPRLAEDVTFTNRLIDVMIRIERAEDSLKTAAENFERFGEDDRARLRLANNLHALSRFVEAETHYEFLIQNEAFEFENQTRGQMMVTAARNSASLGQFDRSNQIFELMWGLGIKSRDYEVEHAVVLEQLGHASQARRIIASKPLTLDQKYRLASMYTSARVHEKAHTVYRNILDEYPDEEIARRRDVKSLIWMEDFDQATPRLAELREDNPDDPSIFLMQVHAMFYAGNQEHAMAQLGRRMDVEPDDPKYWIAWLNFVGDLPEDRAVDSHMINNLADKLLQSDHAMSDVQIASLLARPLARSGKADRAIELLQSALAGDKAQPQLNRELGEVMMIQGKWNEAISYFEVAWKSELVRESVRYRLADAWSRKANYNTAIKLINEGDRNNVEGLELLSSIYINTQRYSLARETIERLIKKRPGMVRYETRLANTWLWEGQYAEAIKRLKVLHAAHREDTGIQLRLGQAQLWAGRHGEAKSIFLELLRDDPNNTAVWLPFIESLSHMEMVSLTDPVFQHIEKNFEQLPSEEAMRIAVRLSVVRMKSGHVGKALQQLRPWMELGRDDVEYQIQLATVLSESGEHGKAREFMRNAMRQIGDRHPMFMQAHFANADIYYRVGDYELALAAYEKIYEASNSLDDREMESILSSLARVHVQLGNFDKAIPMFEQAISLGVDPTRYATEVGGVLARAGQFQQALKLLTPITELPLDAHYLKASIHSQLNQYREASEIYRNLIAVDSQDATAWMGLGDVSAWGKDYKTAVFAYRQLLEIESGNLEAKSRLARVYSWSGQHDLALELTVNLLEQDVLDRELVESLVISASAGGTYRSELVKKQLLRAYHELDSSWDSNHVLMLAEAMLRNNLADPALTLMDQLVAADPTNENFRRRLADELHRLGMFDRADVHYRALLEISARNDSLPGRANMISASQSRASGTPGSSRQVSWTPSR